MRIAQLRVALPGRAGWGLLVGPALLLGLFFAYPLVVVLWGAFGDADAWAWLATPYASARIVSAFQQAVGSVVLTMALALPLAWFYHRRRIPSTRLHLAVHAAPFVLPVFVVVYGIQEVLGPGGWAGSLGVDVLGAVGPMGAVVIAHAYYNYGFAARLLHASLESRPHRLEDAAQVLGASPRGALWRVTARALAPAIANVALLVFLFAFTSFGVVLLLGGGTVATLETMLYQNLRGVFPRYGHAAVLGFLQLTLNLLLLAGYLALRRRHVPRDVPRPAPRASRPDRWASWVLMGLGLTPAAAVLVGGFRVRGVWSLEPWRALLDVGHPAHVTGFSLPGAVGLSLLYAAASAAISLALTLLLAYGVRSIGGPWRRVAELLAALPLGTSSLLIGFGFLITFGAGSWLDLRGTRSVIVLAHALVGFPFTARVLLPALDLRDRRLDEAAATLGAGPTAVAARIHWPLLRGPMIAAAGLAVAMSLGDFGASLILMRPENMALGIWITQHDVPFNSLMQAQKDALAAVLGVLAAVAYVAVERFRDLGRSDL